MYKEIRNKEIKKEELDMNNAPVEDAELENVSGGVETLRRDWWNCPNCKEGYSMKRSPCPNCGYES